MIFKPLHEKVLVEIIKKNERTKTGIIIPDNVKEKPTEGKIISVGTGKVNDMGKIIPLNIKVGNIVIFQKWSGHEIEINNKKFIVIKESDILGKLI